MRVCQVLLAKPCLLCSLLLVRAVTSFVRGEVDLEFSCQYFSYSFHDVSELLVSFLVLSHDRLLLGPGLSRLAP